MKCIGTHWFLGIIFVCVGILPLAAQVESDEQPLLNSESGIRFSKDSLFLMNLRFRMQNRFGLNSTSGEDLNVESFEARVRRLRLRFDGFVGTPKLAYYIQLSFSQSDMNLDNGDVPFPVRDAMVYYFPRKNLYFGFGQSKLPGNRQRVNSSGNLQMPDRSLANNFLTLDRDFGFFGYYDLKAKNHYLGVKTALTVGDGRGGVSFDNGLAYTLRLEYLPLGKFKNGGAYSEGDLERETKPKLSVGVVGHYNQNARFSGGTLGRPLDVPTDMYSAMTDVCFKYRGFSVLGELLYRHAPRTPLASENVVPFTGYGWMATAGYMLSKRSEIVGRYSTYVPDASARAFYPERSQAAMGYNYYIRDHRIKAQGFLGYDVRGSFWDLSRQENGWLLMFQVEFGI